MDRTTILNRLAESERYRLELHRARSQGFRYMALIPFFPYIFVVEVILAKVRDIVLEAFPKRA